MITNTLEQDKANLKSQGYEVRTGYYAEDTSMRYVCCKKNLPTIKGLVEVGFDVYCELIDGSLLEVHSRNGFLNWGFTEEETWKESSWWCYSPDNPLSIGN